MLKPSQRYITTQQFREATRKEMIRLLDKKALGFDVEDSIQLLKDNEKKFLANQVSALKTPEVESDRAIDPYVAARANRQAPRRRITKNGKTSFQTLQQINRIDLEFN